MAQPSPFTRWAVPTTPGASKQPFSALNLGTLTVQRSRTPKGIAHTLTEANFYGEIQFGSIRTPATSFDYSPPKKRRLATSQADENTNSCYSSATVEARQGSNKPHIPEDGLDNIANECDTVRDSVAEIAAGIGQIVIVRRNSGAAYKKPQSIRHFTLSTNLRPNPHLSNNLVRWREEARHHLRRSSSSDMHVVLPTTAAEVRRCRYSVKRKVRCIIKCETRVRFKKSH
ncbi:hypothetical protein B0H10DRAFT_1964892 [Mycena sp. CBHHK59/15]|nr:hypothetical protein B0H10DRAFT_1964892 [Mycena sp. CBHHK59/15]